MTAASLAQFYSGPVEALQRPDRAFVRDVNLMFGAVPSLQTTRALIKQVSQSVSRHHSQSSPPHAKKHGVKEATLSQDKNPKVFRERVKDALRRRIGKGRALTVKQVADAIGCSVSTIENMMSDGGTTEPSSRVLRELMIWFDDSFANEIWSSDGFVIVRLDANKLEAARQMLAAQEQLRKVGGQR